MLKPENEPLPNTVKIKHNNVYYLIPEYEFVNDWLPNVRKEIKTAGLVRGKLYMRYLEEVQNKGLDTNEKNTNG